MRITNQVCQQNPIPVQGCLPDGFGFDTPNAGATTGGVYGGLGGAVAGGLGNPNPPNAYPSLKTGFREMHTDFEPVYKYDENVLTGGVKYDFDQFRVSVIGGYQETEYLSQQDYNMDVGFNLQTHQLQSRRVLADFAPCRSERRRGLDESKL